MRTDLSVRGPDGVERDIAVLAPAGTTWAAVRAAVQQALPGADPSWCGRRALGPGTVVGRPPLVDGAVLSVGPGDRAAGAPASARLDVVGGSDAGAGVPLRHGTVVIGRDPRCDLVLTDPSVSRRHATVTTTAAGSTVRDLGSTTGVHAEGRRIAAPVELTRGSVVRVGRSVLALAPAAGDPSDPPADLRPDGDGGAVLTPAPPVPRPDVTRLVRAPQPPELPGISRGAWLTALLPVLLGAVLAAITGMWLFLAFAALGPLGGGIGAVGDLRRRRHARAAHRRALARTEREIGAALTAEGIRRRDDDADPATILRIASVPTARLWRRHRADPDLLRVRIGLARLPAQVLIERGGERVSAGAVADVPATVDLTAGALGVVGPPAACVDVVRWVLGQLCVLVGPAELEIAVLIAGAAWLWARWLPHVRTRIATTDAERRAAVAELAALARSRRDEPAGVRWRGPWVVALTDPPAAVGLGADLHRVGITAVVVAGRSSAVPSACLQVVRAEADGAEVFVAGTVVREVLADRVGAAWIEQVARVLAPLRQAQPDGTGEPPARSRLLDLLELPDPTAAALRARWDLPRPGAAAVLGVSGAGVVRVDLDRDGPHALVAGSTGAGKSELLQTLVAGLAVDHPPSEVSFLLVDYKGGAAFSSCADLPHTVGLVTDLDEHLTRRVLAALDGEVRRRERLLAAVGAPDLAAYRQTTGNPLARLVIVVDEFAALAEDLGEFVPGLVGIARRGRSLGLHLVLATQRPAGVVSPEIRANTALRVCLRVTSATESLDVVDVPDAAGIAATVPGRGYLRTGSGTTVVQTARVAGPAPERTAEPVRVVLLDAWRRMPAATPATDAATDLDRIVAAARAAADRAPAVPAPHRPWLPALPAELSLPDLPRATDGVAIGLVDLPGEQRQPPLVLDPCSGEVLVLSGPARSGRTTALHTVARAAAARWTPAQLHVHAIDAAGTALAALRALPHTGTVATAEDGFGFTARVVERLGEVVAQRRRRVDLPLLLLLVDGWDQLVDAGDEYDGGRTVQRLLTLVQDARSARGCVVVAGGRAALSARLGALASTRILLGAAEPGDLALAGVAPGAVPRTARAGLGVRVGDGAQVQLARPAERSQQHVAVGSSALRLRPLPRRVALADLPAAPGGIVLGVCGDDARTAVVDLSGPAGCLLVAGPARSGRSTLLRAVLAQSGGSPVVVAATARSPLAAAAERDGLVVLGPRSPDPVLPDRGLVLVDDLETLTDTPTGDALAAWAAAGTPARRLVAAGRSDALLTGFRGLAAHLRAARCGVLLQPGPADGDLLGIGVARVRSADPPGRGLLVPDPAWGLGGDPVPIQVADV